MLCESCSRLIDDTAKTCPYCGSKKVRDPRDEDLCFFAERDALWGPVLADVFKQNGIRFVQREALGAGFTMRAGAQLERHRFYVRYDQLNAAKAVYEDLFPPEDA